MKYILNIFVIHHSTLYDQWFVFVKYHIKVNLTPIKGRKAQEEEEEEEKGEEEKEQEKDLVNFE